MAILAILNLWQIIGGKRDATIAKLMLYDNLAIIQKNKRIQDKGGAYYPQHSKFPTLMKRHSTSGYILFVGVGCGFDFRVCRALNWVLYRGLGGEPKGPAVDQSQ